MKKLFAMLLTLAILAALAPMALAFAEPAPSGSCGEGLRWEISDGVLTVTGEGAMYDYSQQPVPWEAASDSITRVVISDGVTNVGAGAFRNCAGLEEAVLGADVTVIGAEAFAGCVSLKRITIPEGVTEVGDSAFFGCTALTDVYFGGTAGQWNSIAFDWDNDLLQDADIHPARVDESVRVTLSEDAKTAKAESFAGLYARVALVLDNGGVTGLHITSAAINDDGTIVIPAFMVPGLAVKGVCVALVPTYADIQSAAPGVLAADFRLL